MFLFSRSVNDSDSVSEPDADAVAAILAVSDNDSVSKTD